MGVEKETSIYDVNGNVQNGSQSIESIAPAQCISENFMGKALNCCRRIPCCGIILGVLTSIFFGITNLVVKQVPEVNVFVVIGYTLFINFIVFLPFSLYYKYPLLGVPGERVALFTRAFCGFGAVTFGYISYRMIPLSDATTITAACPVFVSIIAWFILKEEFGIFQIFTVALTIIGVALVSKPTFIFGQLGESKISAETRAEGSILALVSCLTAAGVYISIRRLPTTPGLIVINVYCCINVIGAFIVAIILGFFFPQSQFSKGIGVPTTWHEILVLTGGGFAGVIGQICLTSALKIEEAGLIALARTADIIVAFVLQILFISDEIIHWTSYLGAVIVFTAVSVTALRRWLKGKPGQFEQAWNIINCGFARSRDPEM